MLPGLSAESETHLFQGGTRIVTEGIDPFWVEEYFVAGEQGDIVFEFVPEIFIIVYGGEVKYTPSKTLRLPRCPGPWDDHVAIDQCGGKSKCEINVGTFRGLLEQFWPVARRQRRHYLTALIAQPIYGVSCMVCARMGRRGYILDLHPFPSKGQFDAPARLALPV